MAKAKHTIEQIISKLGRAEMEFAQGRTIPQVCRSMGVTERTYYRWRKEYGGLKMDQAKRLKELDQENARLRRVVADLTLDKHINTSNDQFLTILFHGLLNRAPDQAAFNIFLAELQAGLASFVALLTQGTATRDQLVNEFAASPEFRADLQQLCS